MSKLLLASGNPGKLIEIHALLSGIDLELVVPAQLSLQLEVKEDGQTYAENATRKGLAYGRASGLLTLADDSGLEVEALHGQPGIHSARYAPQANATDADRRVYLLQHLRGIARPWKASFHCVIALVQTDLSIEYTEGICPGEIIPDERGHNGFGYDPIFYMPEFGRTMAELTMEEKNHASHRARAIIQMRPILMAHSQGN